MKPRFAVLAAAGTTCPTCQRVQPDGADVEGGITIHLGGGVKVAGVDGRLAFGVLAMLLGATEDATPPLADYANSAVHEHLTGLAPPNTDAYECPCGSRWPVPYPLATPPPLREVPNGDELQRRRRALLA